MSDIRKWISIFENQNIDENYEMKDDSCVCKKWNCRVCFPGVETKVDEGNWYDPDKDDLEIDSEEVEILRPEDYESAWDMISIIKYTQNQGQSGAERPYSEYELENMSMSQLRTVYKDVTGTDILEADTKIKDKTGIDFDPFADIDDILNPKVPTVVDSPDDVNKDDRDQDMLGKFSKSSAANTKSKTSNINLSTTAQDYMSRINPDAGADEPDLIPEPKKTSDEVVVRKANDVPAAIGNAMVAAGYQNPEWHTINNLPGYMQRAIRGMGRQFFGMITDTPLEQILTIANVEGQGPNTNSEIRSVAAWLLANAEALPTMKVSYGMTIPGYEPEVREFRANGVRFHVVKDPMGQYIYAYPEKDAKTGKSQEQSKELRGNTVPRLNEHYQPTLMEQLKWDEEIEQLLKESSILDESTLSKLIGRQKGGKRLVSWLHARHRLSNEAELVPVPYKQELLWTQFKKNPDDFVIVSAENGVAGIKPSMAHIEQQKKRYEKMGKTYNPAGDTTLRYQIIAFTDDGEQVDPALLRPPPESVKIKKDGSNAWDVVDKDPTVTRSRMGMIFTKDTQVEYNVFELLKDQIGRIKTVWISGWTGYRGTGDESEPTGSVERDKMARRAAMKEPETLSDNEATNRIFKRIRPVLSTIVNQAMSHVMRRAQRYIEGGNFEGASQLTKKGERLKEILATIDTTRDITLDGSYGSATRELSRAVTGALEHGFHQSSHSSLSDFLNDVAKGNASALKPVLDGIRANIIG